MHLLPLSWLDPFWVIWRIDIVANLSGDRLSMAVVELAIVAQGQGRGGAVIG